MNDQHTVFLKYRKKMFRVKKENQNATRKCGKYCGSCLIRLPPGPDLTFCEEAKFIYNMQKA